MLPICLSDVRDWDAVARSRLYGAISIAVTRSTRFQEFQQSISFVNQLNRNHCRDSCAWREAFVDDAACAFALQLRRLYHVVQSSYEHVNGPLSSPQHPQLVSGTFHWARFVTQKQFTLYFDEVEGVGVVTARSAHPYEGGHTLWPLIGPIERVATRIALAKLESSSDRWSYFGDLNKPMYLGGPVSLINHACRRHSNVILKFIEIRDSAQQIQRYPGETMVAVAETRINANDRIYTCYDDNADDLFITRGIRCRSCIVY